MPPTPLMPVVPRLDNRRELLLRALAIAGAATTGPAWEPLAARRQAVRSRRIDVHHHFAPPAWIAAVNGRPMLQSANARSTPEQSIDDLDKGGTSAALI